MLAVLFLLVLATLLLSRFEVPAGWFLDFGATMTSESGEILTKGWVEDGTGVRDVMTMLTEEVGVRWRVRGCCCA